MIIFITSDTFRNISIFHSFLRCWLGFIRCAVLWVSQQKSDANGSEEVQMTLCSFHFLVDDSSIDSTLADKVLCHSLVPLSWAIFGAIQGPTYPIYQPHPYSYCVNRKGWSWKIHPLFLSYLQTFGGYLVSGEFSHLALLHAKMLVRHSRWPAVFFKNVA